MLRGVIKQYRELRAESYLDVHVGCFSEAEDTAGQWRAYGDEGRGYSLEFDLSQLDALHSLVELSPGDIERLVNSDAPAAGLDVLPVVYRNVRQSILVQRAIAAAVAQVRYHSADAPEHGFRIAKRASAALFRCAAALACQFKRPEWAHEREWRLALIGQPGHVAPPVTIPFRDLLDPTRTPLRGVTVGPLGPDLAAVRRQLEALGHPGVSVARSTVNPADCRKPPP